MRSFTTLLLASSLALFAVPGCAVDDDTTETSGGDTGAGDGVALDATPAPDTAVDSGTPDTTVEEDTTVPDTTVPPDTFVPDTFVPDTFVFVDTGFPFDTAIDTTIPDGFVPPECTTPADCPFADLECAKKTCIANKCGVAFVAKGTLTGPQTAGDCKARVCDGAGLAALVDDNADIPKDAGQCIEEVCVAGVPTLRNAAVGTACSTSLGTKCDGLGACVQCLTASECPGTDLACTVRTCTAGTCGTTKIGVGLPASTQTPGDCYRTVCTAAGTTNEVYDAKDLPSPDRLRTCRTPVCSVEGPYETYKPRGTACEGGNTCGHYLWDYDDGVCGECDLPEDCDHRGQGVSAAGGLYGDSCQKSTCTAHKCGEAFEAVGTACTTGYYACPGTCTKDTYDETGVRTYCQTTGPCGPTD